MNAIRVENELQQKFGVAGDSNCLWGSRNVLKATNLVSAFSVRF